MIKLSKRMKAVASMVTQGYKLCDVGTDHGYVPISLVADGTIPEAIAVDINKGPLERANLHIRSCGLEDKITTRLSDGLSAVKEGEAESIIIAGMGGELVIHILTEGDAVCKKAKELILQPQSDIHKVRYYVRNAGYKIVDEDMVLEDGKYYPIMRVVNDTNNYAWDNMDDISVAVCAIRENGDPFALFNKEHERVFEWCRYLRYARMPRISRN